MCAAVLLVLSSVFYLVTSPVFASEDSVPFFQIFLSYSNDGSNYLGGNWYGLNDFLTNSPSSGHDYWRIEAFRFFLGNTYPSELTLSFVIGGAYKVVNYDPSISISSPLVSWENWNGQKGGTIYTSYPNGNPSNNAYWYCYCVSAGMIASHDYLESITNNFVIGENLKQINIRFRPNVTSDTNTQSVFVLNTPIIFKTLISASTVDKLLPFITNVTLIQNYSPILNSIFTELQSNHSALMSKLTDYFADTQNNYTWNEIQANSDGSSTIVSQSGNWWSAMLGQLRSLNNDAQTQAYQQSKAEDAGAMDALDHGFDTAVDHDVFWFSIDMFGLGEMGSYNNDTVSEWGGDGLLEWFSSRTRDDLDQVPITRRNTDDHYISFYSDHIDEILSILGVEDQRGDNPTYYRGD